MPPNVAEVFDTYPAAARVKAMEIRGIIFATAKAEATTPLTETLKWGQPSYLTPPNIGSTIRLGWSSKSPTQISVYFICTTHLVDRFREIYPDTFEYEGNRVIHFDITANIPEKELAHCFAMALTYHKNKR